MPAPATLADDLRSVLEGGAWHGPALLARIGPLSANYRTLAVGAAMLAGRPHWYFLFEIVVLGAVLVASLARVRQVMEAVLIQAGASNTLR